MEKSSKIEKQKFFEKKNPKQKRLFKPIEQTPPIWLEIAVVYFFSLKPSFEGCINWATPLFSNLKFKLFKNKVIKLYNNIGG